MVYAIGTFLEKKQESKMKVDISTHYVVGSNFVVFVYTAGDHSYDLHLGGQELSKFYNKYHFL